jgi:hypothetical protein
METEEFGGLWQRGFPWREENCEGERSHHAIKESEIQLIWLRFDAWRWRRREFSRVCMKPLTALCAVATNLREFMSTGWTEFHGRFHA